MSFYDLSLAYMSIDLSNSFIDRLYSYRVVYVGFVNGGFEILWCEYLWVAKFLAGGLGVLPHENFEILKCSRSDSRPTEG